MVTYSGKRTGNPMAADIGHREKKYRITPSIYWKIASSAIKQFQERQNKLTFLTFTFPDDISEELANVGMSRFLDNFKKTYDLRSYIWTKELTERGRPHFHAICDFPYQPIHEINDAWCSAIGMGAKNAVRLPPDGSVVKNFDSLLRYMCKYISKSFNTEYKARCYSISRNVLAKPVTVYHEGVVEYMKNTEWKVKHAEHFSVYTVEKIENSLNLIENIQWAFEIPRDVV